MLKWGGTVLLALALVSAPVSVRSSAPGVVHIGVNEACGQATACTTAPFYICSMTHQDLVEYKCTLGCDE